MEVKGPRVLTWSEHNGGTNLFMVHPYLWKHNFPSKRTYQIFQAVIQPRLLKPGKFSGYSISFQIFHQNRIFNGIDTCSATRFVNFNFIIFYLWKLNMDPSWIVLTPMLTWTNLDKIILKYLNLWNQVSANFQLASQVTFIIQNIEKEPILLVLNQASFYKIEWKINRSDIFLITDTVNRLFVHLHSIGKNVNILIKIWLHMVSYSQQYHFFNHQMKIQVIFEILQKLFVELEIYGNSSVILIFPHQNDMFGYYCIWRIIVLINAVIDKLLMICLNMNTCQTWIASYQK